MQLTFKEPFGELFAGSALLSAVALILKQTCAAAASTKLSDQLRGDASEAAALGSCEYRDKQELITAGIIPSEAQNEIKPQILVDVV